MMASAYRSSKKDHLPSLSEVYSYVQEEEDCHHAMLSLTPPLSTEKSVFIFSAWRGGRRASRVQWGVVGVVFHGMVEISLNVSTMAIFDV